MGYLIAIAMSCCYCCQGIGLLSILNLSSYEHKKELDTVRDPNRFLFVFYLSDSSN